jgi:sigma-B regulation protein RsbU (phosphoserine phosphatase)
MKSIERFEKFFKKASRQEIYEEFTKYLTLLDLNEQLISSLNFKEVLENVLKLACEFTGAEKASIFLINRQDKVLEFAATTDKQAEKLKDIKIPMGSGIAGHVAETGEIINILDAQNDPHFYQKVDQKTGIITRSYLCVPLHIRDEIIGTAQLMNKVDADHFSEADERFMISFSSQAALAIETAILHKQSLEKQAIEQEL